MILDVLHRLILGPLELLFDTVYTVGYRITGNPGLSIILLSLAMNLLMLPLYRRADALQEEERIQARLLKPGIEKIRRAFQGDERFMILQTYYRQNNYKPWYVLKGSLSLLLEIPFFIAAYRYLSGLSLLHGAAFGPIADLGKPDQLISLFGMNIHLLPIMMTVINIVSGAIYGMALIFLVLLYGSPSGLVFYWTLNNLFSLIKNIILKKTAPADHPAAEKALPGKPATDRSAAADRPYRFIFPACCVFLTILLGILIPSAIVSASPAEFVELDDFRSPLRYLLPSALLAAGAFLIWCVIFFRLSSGKGRKRFTLAAVILSVVSVVNYMFFGTEYGNLSALLKYDNPPSVLLSDTLLNLGIILLAACIVVLIWKKKPEILKAVCIAGCIGLAVMSAGNIRKINSSFAELEVLTAKEREKSSFTLSRTGRNVVVIMLDRCISGFVPYIFEENPAVAEQFRGFTYYPNTLSFGRNTNVATPSLFAGYEYRPFELDKRDTGLPEKQNEALKVLPVLFMENGYDVTVCDPPYAGYLWIPDLSIFDDYPSIRRYITHGAFVDNSEIFRKKDRIISRNLFCYSVFRSAPVLLQTVLYNEGRYNEAEALNTSEESSIIFTEESEFRSTGIADEFMKAYTALQHLPAMTKTDGSAQNTFMILSNTATHDVTMLQEPAFVPQKIVDNTEYEAAHKVRRPLKGLDRLRKVRVSV